MKIEQDLSAYGEQDNYCFDNLIVQRQYPIRVSKRLKEHFSKRDNNLSCLELGLGHGYASEFFDTEFQFKKHIVLDGDAEIIRKYLDGRKNIKAEIVETYFEDYQTEETYDVIIMGFILEHVDNPVAILEKYRKFLNPDGVLYIAVPNSESLHRRVGYKAGLLEDTKALSEDDLRYGHKRYYDVDMLREDCEKAGLTVTAMEGIYLKPVTTGQMVALNLSSKVIDAFCEVGIDYPELCNALLAEAIF